MSEVLLGYIVGVGIGFVFLWWMIYDHKQRNTHIQDGRGYLRNGYGRLVHRDIAYHHIYKEGFKRGIYRDRFGNYDVHHKDGNKLNNHPDNLQILTRLRHMEKHGQVY